MCVMKSKQLGLPIEAVQLQQDSLQWASPGLGSTAADWGISLLDGLSYSGTPFLSEKKWGQHQIFTLL